jgi:hypothetical protein
VDTSDQQGTGGRLTLRGVVADLARREARLRAEARAAGLSRREFLEVLAAGAAGTIVGVGAARARAAAPSPAEAGAPAAPPARSRVAVVRHPEVLVRGYRVNPLVIRQMLDRAVMELTGQAAEKAAWQTFGRADDFVAIKYNSMGRPTLHSHAEITEAVGERLVSQAGCDPKKVLAVDRGLPDPYNELSAPFDLPSRGLKTRLRRLYTDAATAIVNVSVLKTHWNDGISGPLKNHLGSVHNPAAYHGWEPGGMARSLPELNALPPLGTKTRLCILDAVRPLYAGGPADDEKYRWDYRGLIVGADPVAVTAVGLRVLEARRAEAQGKEWPLPAAREMLAYAQEIHLGSADPQRIDLLQVDM